MRLQETVESHTAKEKSLTSMMLQLQQKCQEEQNAIKALEAALLASLQAMQGVLQGAGGPAASPQPPALVPLAQAPTPVPPAAAPETVAPAVATSVVAGPVPLAPAPPQQPSPSPTLTRSLPQVFQSGNTSCRSSCHHKTTKNIA